MNHTTTHTTTVPASAQDPILSTLNGSEEDLLIEALCHLRATKVEALATLSRPGMPAPQQPFTPHDFGIPQIDALLARLGVASEDLFDNGNLT